MLFRSNKSNLQSLPLYSLIAQEIHISNHDLFQSKTVKIDCSEYKADLVESYFYGTEPDVVTICPASTSIIVVFFKITNAFNKIELPTIKFETNVTFEDSHCLNMVECCIRFFCFQYCSVAPGVCVISVF